MGKVVRSEYRVERALGGAQVQAGVLDVVRFPQEARLITGSPQRVIFQRGLGGGSIEDSGRTVVSRGQAGDFGR